jgi:hypothetical protein
VGRRTDVPDFVEAIAPAGLPEEDLNEVLAQSSRSGVGARHQAVPADLTAG